ncbi:MAG: CoA-binding protein [Candidatus Hydrogenedentes bacterium]|nr:CoA-binding protein [Candidatus Hydrogenedentota bacterium]
MAKTVAILGASASRRKFGNKAVRAYREAGWTVYPVNPHATEIEGIKAYQTLADIPDRIDRVSVYLPPELSEALLDEIAEVQPQDVYFNPGAGTPGLVREARARGITAHLACSIVAIGQRPDSFGDE